jgi:hypothetical protein
LPGYPVANTIDGVTRNFSDINGVVSASQNTNLDLGNPKLKPELYIGSGIRIRN